MKTYNYFEAVKEDVKTYIENEIDIKEELEEENLCHNMDLLKEALEEFGCGVEYLENGRRQQKCQL